MKEDDDDEDDDLTSYLQQNIPFNNCHRVLFLLHFIAFTQRVLHSYNVYTCCSSMWLPSEY